MRRGIFAVVLAASCLHCHSSKKNGSSSGSGATVTPHILVRTPTTPEHSLTAAGSAVNGGLSSLKYYIGGITLCKDVTLDGSGTSAANGCVSVYKGPDDALLFPAGSTTPDYVAMAAHARTVGTASANNHGTGYGYIDLLDPISRSAVQSSTTFTAEDVGDYNFGLVYWAYPAKLTATLTTAGGNDVLFTHDGNTQASTHPGGTSTTFAPDLTVGPASEAVVNLATAGTWFKLQAPLSITSEDVAHGTDITLELSFDPNGSVSGYNSSVYGWPQLTDAADDTNTNGNYISVPFLDLTPIPHVSGDTVRVETYMGTIDTGTTDHLDVRVELYSVSQDENHTIYGVSTTPLVNAATATAFAGFGKAAFIKTNADGSLDLLDWGQTTFVSGLVRQTAVGSQTTVSIACALSGSTTPLFVGCTAPLRVALTCVDISDIF